MTKFCIPIVLAISLTLASCTSHTQIPATKHIVAALCENEINLPAGAIYSSDDADGDKGGLPDTLLPSYFGVTDIEKYSNDWLSCSIFLASANSPCEFAIIHCSTPESLTDTARLLFSRAESKARLVNFDEYTSQVICMDNYAILIISNDVESSIKSLKKALR